MYESHTSFEEPSDDTVIWRYMDLAKFASLIFTQSLHFSRVDKLNDPKEGALQIEKFKESIQNAKKKEIQSDRAYSSITLLPSLKQRKKCFHVTM